MNDCVSAFIHLERGWIIKNEQGHLRLPGNFPIKTDGVRSRKDVVEALHKSNGTVTVPKAAAASAFLQEKEDVSTGHGHYQLSNDYNLSQNLMNLTKEYGSNSMRRVMMLHMRENDEEEDEPTMGTPMGNFH